MKKILVTVCLLMALMLGGCYPAPGTYTTQEEVNDMPGLSPLALEFSRSTNAVEFGAWKFVRNLDNISVSVWIYQDTDPGASDVYMIAATSAGMGWYLSAVDNGVIKYEHAGDPGSVGAWTTGTSAYSLGTWTHVVFTRDITPTSNAPTIYIQGSSVSVSGAGQVGNNQDETGSGIIVGNLLNDFVEYTYGFDGKIFDLRIYNRILTQAEVTAIYNSGTPSATAGTRDYSQSAGGLVFQGFAVRTENLADYVDQALTAANGLKVRDAQFGAVGGMNGTVTGRAAP